MNTWKVTLAFRGARYALPTALLFGGLAPASGSFAQETYRLDGGRVAIYNLAGEVEVVRGRGSQVEVDISRGGADRARLQVEVGRVGNAEALRVIYPEDRIVYERMGRSNTTIRVRDDGTFFGNRSFGGLWDGDEVRISGRGRGLEAHADMVVRVPAGVDVAIFLAAGSGRAGGLESDLGFRTASGAVEVAGIVGDVDVDTGSGSVTIADVEGDVTADTGSGSIGLEDIRGGRLSADTGSGRVNGSNVSVGELHVDTGSGGIRIEGLSAADVECDTGSGSVHLGMLSDVDRLVVDTGSGSVSVEVPRDFGAELELDTGSGGISVDVPDRVVESSRRHHFRGSVGDGDGTVEIDTGSGGVTIRRG